MAYKRWDGFTERLLDFTLLVDRDYHLQLAYHSHQWNGKHDDGLEMGFTSSAIPNGLRTFLQSLDSNNVNELKQEYVATNITVDDAGGEEYLFKLGNKTKYIRINPFTLLTEACFEKPIEKEFFALHQMMEKWTMQLYDSYENLCAMPLHSNHKRK